MDFFEHQEDARKRSGWLVAMFVLAVAVIVGAVYLTAVALWAYLARNGMVPGFRLWDPTLFLGVAAGTSAIIGLGSLYKITALRSGGGAGVAGLLGGKLLTTATRDADERRLLNVVEEMAIASGIPVPQVYVLHNESSINAFAAGFSPDQAVIGVTRGCMKLLSRDELQGVIGHEFSHILNGDMRLNIRLMGVIHGILVIALIGYMMMRSSGRGKDSNKAALAGVALFIIGYAGVFFGRLIKAAVSRQREFLADASSVQFTRNPDGIAGALKKIGGLGRGARMRTPRAEEASHLFFGNALGRSFFAMLSTHPPLPERIRRIDPQFDGSFPEVDLTPLREAPARRPAGTPGKTRVPGRPDMMGAVAAGAAVAAGTAAGGGDGPAKGAGGPAPGGGPPAPPRPPAPEGAGAPRAGGVREGGRGGAGSPPMDPSRAVARIGSLSRAHIEHASRLLEALGEDLVRHAREVPDALVVVYALLLSPDQKVRRRQLEALTRAGASAELELMTRLYPAIAAAPREARLPLMDLAVPSLRRLSDEQFHAFYQNMEALIAADERVDVAEFTVRHAILRHVAPQFGGRRVAGPRKIPVHRLAASASVLLSCLARADESDQDEARKSFEAGRLQMGWLSGKVELLPVEQCDLPALDRALRRLDQALPPVKKLLVAGATATVARDGRATLEEAELLRAVGHALDCPTPPFIPGVEI